jgi:hypothetical protein
MTCESRHGDIITQKTNAVKMWTCPALRIRTLTLTSSDGRTETIRTTDEHPFWLEGTGWTAAGQLAVGQQVDLIDGSDATVTLSTRTEYQSGIAVFNFEVEGDHTYFVEDGQETDAAAVWVHNTCPIFNQPRPIRDMPGQILGKPHHPTKTLMQNMEKAGVPKVDGASPHHIVPGGSSTGAPAKAVLDKHNIDINQADNGVYLAAPGRQAPDPTIGHGATFSHAAYGDAVSRRIVAADAAGLDPADARNKVLDEMAKIREDLLNGTKFW